MRKQIALTLLLPLAALPGCAEPDDVGGHLRGYGAPAASCEENSEDTSEDIPFAMCEIECDLDHWPSTADGCETVVWDGESLPTIEVSVSAEGPCFDELEESLRVQYPSGTVLNSAPAPNSPDASAPAPVQYACALGGLWVPITTDPGDPPVEVPWE